jgi:hypothetical protein
MYIKQNCANQVCSVQKTRVIENLGQYFKSNLRKKIIIIASIVIIVNII